MLGVDPEARGAIVAEPAFQVDLVPHVERGLREVPRDPQLGLVVDRRELARRVGERVRLGRQERVAHAAELPPKIAIHPRPEASFVHAMPAHLRAMDRAEASADLVGMKWVAGYATNTRFAFIEELEVWATLLDELSRTVVARPDRARVWPTPA